MSVFLSPAARRMVVSLTEWEEHGFGEKSEQCEVLVRSH